MACQVQFSLDSKAYWALQPLSGNQFKLHQAPYCPKHITAAGAFTTLMGYMTYNGLHFWKAGITSLQYAEEHVKALNSIGGHYIINVL